LIADIIKSESV